MWLSRLVPASFQAWCLSTTSRAGASSTLRRPVGLRITAISRSALTCMNVRADGGIADAQVVGDTDAAVKWMRTQTNHNGKIGVFGSCSGGRHAVIYASQRKDVDACADLWGGRVVMGKEELNDKTPVAPIEMTKDLSCPPIGIFGNEDRAPSPEQVNEHEAALKKHGKIYEFYRYDGAGHGIWYWHWPLYRPEQARMAGARSSPSSASIWRSRRAEACVRPSSRSHVQRAWQSAGTSGSRSPRRWLLMTTRAMRRWAMSSRSTLSTLALTPGRERGLS